ncbi:hypothetical protein AB4Y45_32600 [Paraburkholderia sp. EG287A]|uniref:hypothetical protein n=1 Tax=Paraburkholderia sp. EG287A TaxID=3237012 RepID=UPI0034D28ECF
MANTKFTLDTRDTITHDGRKLYRIKALKNIGLHVFEGNLGGYVEHEKNLDSYGTSWIDVNARVYGDAQIADDSQVSNFAQVCGNALLSGNATVFGQAIVRDQAKVRNDAQVGDNAQILESAVVTGYSFVRGNAIIRGAARIHQHARVAGGLIEGNASVGQYARLMQGNARIESQDDILLQAPVGPSSDAITAYRTSTGGIELAFGREFVGTLEAFREMVSSRFAHADQRKVLTQLLGQASLVETWFTA